MPHHLSEDQRQNWLRRQRTAENTLAIQALGGTVPNEETLSYFHRYVSGEITLAQAIAQVREQMAQEHAAFRQYLNRGSVISANYPPAAGSNR
ncbi:antitoxin VbhA family protein [Hymenobacter jeongseonensis]|nr:antitoxin VbhA family protein [Hymenobacter jeongseonensis]